MKTPEELAAEAASACRNAFSQAGQKTAILDAIQTAIAAESQRVSELEAECQNHVEHLQVERAKTAAEKERADRACIDLYEARRMARENYDAANAYLAENDRLAAELAALRAENERLREKLGESELNAEGLSRDIEHFQANNAKFMEVESARFQLAIANDTLRERLRVATEALQAISKSKDMSGEIGWDWTPDAVSAQQALKALAEKPE